MNLHEAKFYKKNKDLSVNCQLCPHNCLIENGDSGICHVRKNIDGLLFNENYGRITSMSLRAVENDSVYLYRSGCDVLSVGSYGCNFKCAFCNNHHISQHPSRFKYISPEKLVSIAKENVAEGNVGISYTYNEPIVGYEYIADCSKLANKVGLINILATNGFINEKPLKSILPFIDAVSIDLKSFSDSFYYNVCGGSIEPVKKAIHLCAKHCHVEITTLIIPGYNDSKEEVESIAKFIASVSDEIPFHLVQHKPSYKMLEPKSIEKENLLALARIAAQHLKNVYCSSC